MKELPRRWFLHVFLFLATFATASFSQGVAFGVALMAILLAHESGHYFACRKHGVAATLPFFIPMPNIVGTLGAVIAMKSAIPSRKALFDIGISGPLAGLVVAIPVTVVGLSLSTIELLPRDQMHLWLGEPLFFSFLAREVLGPIPVNHDIVLHPLAFAGWAALFITSINLLPIGQLDGGHVVWALFGKRAQVFSWAAVVGLIFLGYFFQPIWYIFLAVMLFFLFRDPVQPKDTSPLGVRRKVLGVVLLLAFVLSFIPTPFEFRLL